MKRDLIDITDLSVEEIDELIAKAEDIIENPENYREKCRYKKLATLFYEPSTRTRLSFESAMYELGGQVIGFHEAQSSSATKGESVADPDDECQELPTERIRCRAGSSTAFPAGSSPACTS